MPPCQIHPIKNTPTLCSLTTCPSPRLGEGEGTWLGRMELVEVALKRGTLFSPFHLERTCSASQVSFSVLPPHEMFAFLFELDRFNDSVVGLYSTDGLRHFWEVFKSDPSFSGNPLLASDLSKTVPIAYHVDGAEVYSNSEYYFYSWRSLTSTSKDTTAVVFPICAIPHFAVKKAEVREKAMDEIARVVAWSQKALDAGVWPTHGFDGEAFAVGSKRARRAGCQLAGGYRGHYAVWQGDVKARCQVHRFSNHAQCSRICDSCGACQLFRRIPAALNYATFEPSAGRRVE